MSKEVIDVEVVQENAVEEFKPTTNKLEVKREILDWGQLMEMSAMLAKSTIIPINYQNRPENILVAVDLASRMGLSPLAVMQSLYVIQGRPSFSGQAIASLIRTSGQFKNVELIYVGEEGKDDWGAYVQAERSGKLLKGTTVTIGMAKKEGWYQKGGSKWQTLPQQMMAYRAYTFFGRLYAPELMMGLHTTDELEDIISEPTLVENPYEKR